METNTREDVIAELRAALVELEGGAGLSLFVGGHGLMSRRFEFSWSEPTLDINFQLPYARVLADEESQKEDDAEIGAAIRRVPSATAPYIKPLQRAARFGII